MGLTLKFVDKKDKSYVLVRMSRTYVNNYQMNIYGFHSHPSGRTK